VCEVSKPLLERSTESEEEMNPILKEQREDRQREKRRERDKVRRANKPKVKKPETSQGVIE